MELWQACKALEASIIETRRELHKWPEIGRELPRTRALICARLDQLGIPYTLNPADDGLYATIEGGFDGPMIAFRADVDALHIHENTGKPYTSQIPGQMHGCGHDAHGAMLLGAAEVLQANREQLHGKVRLLFESGEETGTGATDMIEAGGLEGVDALVGLHVGNLAGSDVPSGTFSAIPGPVSAGKDRVFLTVHGKACHGAFPQDGVDPIWVGSQIVAGFHNILARELPAGTAAVLTVGSFQSGEDHNSIPSKAEMKGSIRTQNPAIRNFIVERMHTMVDHISAAYRAKADLTVKKGSSPVMNDPALTALSAEAIGTIPGIPEVRTSTPYALMGSDDFAYYAARVPSSYIFLSTANPALGTDKPNHSPEFDIDESVLWLGAAAYVAIARRYLNAE